MPTPRKSSITAHIGQRRISRERILFRRRLTTRSPARSLPSKRPSPSTRRRVRHPERRHKPRRNRHSPADRTRAKARDYISDMEPTDVVAGFNPRSVRERARETTSRSGCCIGSTEGARASVWRRKPFYPATFHVGGSIGSQILSAGVREAGRFRSHFRKTKECLRSTVRKEPGQFLEPCRSR